MPNRDEELREEYHALRYRLLLKKYRVLRTAAKDLLYDPMKFSKQDILGMIIAHDDIPEYKEGD